MESKLEQKARKKNRLVGYDYSSEGSYFVTACVKDRQELFWEQPVGATIGRPSLAIIPNLSKTGIVVESGIKQIGHIYDTGNVDNYVVMPNHIHMIMTIMQSSAGDGRPMVAPTVSRVMKQLKGSITKQLGYSIWQKLFHDRIIRNQEEYNRIAEYIENNPSSWEDDCFHPSKADI